MVTIVSKNYIAYLKAAMRAYLKNSLHKKKRLAFYGYI